MQKRALQGQTELNQNMSDSFRVTAYSWRVSQHANRPVAAKELKVTFEKSESLQWCWSITAYSLLLWLLGISDELNMSEGLQMMGCFKKTNRQKLQKQHVYKIKTSSCSQTLSHCEVAGTHGWLQASLLLFTPFFFFRRTKGGRQLDFHRRREYNKKKNWLIFLFPHNLRIKAAAASHIQPTQPWARILWLRCLLPFQTHCIDVDTNKRRRLQIHFMIYGSTFALFEWVSNISATNFLPVWECVIVKTRMRRFDKTRSPKIAQR